MSTREMPSEPGEVVLFVQTQTGPAGMWCVTRAGPRLRATSVLPAGTEARGAFQVLGDEVWAWYGAFGEYQAAKLDGCKLADPLTISGNSRFWSNAAPVYLIQDEGTLSVAAPGASPIVVDQSVADARWSTRSALAYYRRDAANSLSPGELFVLDLGPELDLTVPPTYVRDEVIAARWSPGDEWLVFSTQNADGAGLHAWSRASRMVTGLGEYPGYTSIEFVPGPDGRHVLVYLPRLTTDDGTVFPAERRILALEDGVERARREQTTSDSSRWLWPEAWLQIRSDQEDAVLLDVSGAGAVTTTALGAPLDALSPQAGVATQASDPPRLVSGLPGEVSHLRDLAPYYGSGWFSPGGQYFAAIDHHVDESGRLKDHDGLLHVAETTAGGASWVAGSLDRRNPSVDGIRWLDESSFVFMLSDGDGTALLLAELRGTTWEVSELKLPSEATNLRFFVVSADPCEAIPLLSSISVPGCAAPWRLP